MKVPLRFLYLIPFGLLAAAIAMHFRGPEDAAESLGNWCFGTLGGMIVGEALGLALAAAFRRIRGQ